MTNDEYQGWKPDRRPTDAELAREYRLARGKLVLRNMTNLTGGLVWSWLLLVLAALSYNRTATSPPDPVSSTELVTMATVLTSLSLAGYWLLVVPKVVTYSDGTACVINPFRSHIVDLARVDVLESSRRTYPRLIIAERAIWVIGLEQPLFESIADTSENTALLQGELENARELITSRGKSEPVRTRLTNPGIGGWLILGGWSAYVFSFFIPYS